MLVMAALLLGDAPWMHRVLVAAAWLAPIPVAVVVLVLVLRAVRTRPASPMGREAALLVGVVSSLQSGQPLRPALATLSPVVSRLVATGAGTDELAAAVGSVLEEHGTEAAAAVRLLDRAGGPAAGVFAQLAAQAADVVRVRREVRAAVAAPVLQGVVVGGAPLVTLGYLVVSGRFVEMFAQSPAHAVSVTAGAAMTILGVGWVAMVVRKALP